MTCPFCNSADVRAHSDARKNVVLGRRKKSVKGYQYTVCNACGDSFVTPTQHDANVVLTDTVMASLTPITPKEVRELRSKMYLSQSQAQNIFGGGPNAFSKYETGKVVPSDALARLLRAAYEVPGLLAHLAAKTGVALEDRPRFHSKMYATVYAHDRLSMHESLPIITRMVVPQELLLEYNTSAETNYEESDLLPMYQLTPPLSRMERGRRKH